MLKHGRGKCKLDTVIIDKQYPKRRRRRGGKRFLLFFLHFLTGAFRHPYGEQRHAQCERTSFARHAVHIDCPLKQLHKHTYNGEPKAEPLLALCTGQAGKLLKNPFPVGRFHSFARIGNGNNQPTVLITRRHRHAAFVCELHCIGE